MEKTCTKCALTLPATREFFHRHPISKDGLKPRCKACQCAAQSARNERRTLDERRALWSRARKQSPQCRQKACRRWIAANPNKRRAHWTVQNALKRGSLKRAACERCGSDETQAHHDDYAQPLAVRWLCAFHHAEVHVRLRRTEATA